MLNFLKTDPYIVLEPAQVAQLTSLRPDNAVGLLEFAAIMNLPRTSVTVCKKVEGKYV